MISCGSSKMILADEVAAIEEKLQLQASRKELALYQKLIGNPLPYPGDNKLTDIEQVCLSAFCTGAPNKADLVERFRRSKPIKGIHYANNLVELSAFAIYDRDSEVDHLKSFCSTSSTRDHLILNQLFPDVCTSRPSTTRAVLMLTDFCSVHATRRRSSSARTASPRFFSLR